MIELINIWQISTYIINFIVKKGGARPSMNFFWMGWKYEQQKNAILSNQSKHAGNFFRKNLYRSTYWKYYASHFKDALSQSS
jgi:hypothetical protein